LPDKSLPDKSLLRVDLSYRRGGLALDVYFKLSEPWTVLFGASGSGKTTVLRAVQGFVRPDGGRIVAGERELLDTEHRIFMPAHRRPVRCAGQAARLFAGMTVRENILYGAGPGGGWTMDEVLELFRIEARAGERPGRLSGGERQRVSVARAVVAAASVPGALLLLDEPFGGLDFALRDALAVELREWLRRRGTPVLSVTHDVGEAFLLGAEVLRLEGGRIVDQGPVERVLAMERERLLGQLRVAAEVRPSRR
jgi:molybdate transport system ATP-binding protein